MVLGILSSILSFAVFIGLIALIVNAARRGSGGAKIDATSVRRFFQYLLLYILVVVVGTGISDLIGRMLGAEVPEWQDANLTLARGLAFVGVGIPLTAALAWWTMLKQRTDPTEARSGLFALYLTAGAITGVVIAANSLPGLFRAGFSEGRLDADDASALIAWGLVGIGHWYVARRSLDEDFGTPHLMLGSLVGLVMGTTGLITTLGLAVDQLWQTQVTVRPTADIAESAGVLVAGALVWGLYWVFAASKLPRRGLWLFFVLPVGVGGGMILTLVAASRLLWRVLVWFLGDPASQTARVHFHSAPTEAAAIVIGLLVWWYHKTILGQAAGERSEIQRVHEYLVSGIGMTATAFGVGTVLVALIESVTPGTDTGVSTMNTLLAAITLLIVGVPVWLIFWRRIRLALAAETTAEVVSLSRRIYLVALFGITGIAAVVALLALAYVFLTDAVSGQLGLATLHSMRYALGVLAATASVSAYHGAIFRQDRTQTVPTHTVGPRSITLVGAVDPELERTLAKATGARTQLWGRLDQPSPPWDKDALLAFLDQYTGHDVVVIADAEAFRVLVVDPSGRHSANPQAPQQPQAPRPDAPQPETAMPPEAQAQPNPE